MKNNLTLEKKKKKGNELVPQKRRRVQSSDGYILFSSHLGGITLQISGLAKVTKDDGNN